ncbi:MAG: TRAP transporter large permease subunit [Alphaproteobacteria bacterium]|nr:MAG: TRAP transporter large permease subunit [Alphaproteobacteria bacterium]
MVVQEALDMLMFATACGLLLSGFPVAFTLAGTALIFAGIGHALGVFDISFLGAFPQRIFGNMTNEVLMAVPLFVFMGVMLERSRVAEELLDSMGKLFGNLRGGLGISVSIVGALMAASTGIVGATVVTMGLLALPTMIRRGYDPALAAGSISAAGTLGQIIPPSIVLVLLGDVLSSAYQDAQRQLGNWTAEPLSVGDLFAGALLPGLGLVLLYILYQIAVAIFRPDAAPAIPRDEIGSDEERRAALRHALHAVVPPVVLIVAVLGSIMAGIATPTEAAGVGAMGATLLAGLRLDEARPAPIVAGGAALVLILILTSLFDLRLGRETIALTERLAIGAASLACVVLIWGIVVSLRRTFAAGILTAVSRSTLEITAMVFVILIGAAMFSLVFRGLGGDDAVHELLSGLPGGAIGAIFVVMLVMFVLGFFLDFIEITFVVVPIVAPALFFLGVDPVWLGVMMAINLQTSFLTPPFGFALFYLRGVAPESITTRQIYKGALPFVGIQVAALLILALFPAIATWLPAVIFG